MAAKPCSFEMCAQEESTYLETGSSLYGQVGGIVVCNPDAVMPH